MKQIIILHQFTKNYTSITVACQKENRKCHVENSLLHYYFLEFHFSILHFLLPKQERREREKKSE
jgi:hypothetical protein